MQLKEINKAREYWLDVTRRAEDKDKELSKTFGAKTAFSFEYIKEIAGKHLEDLNTIENELLETTTQQRNNKV